MGEVRRPLQIDAAGSPGTAPMAQWSTTVDVSWTTYWVTKPKPSAAICTVWVPDGHSRIAARARTVSRGRVGELGVASPPVQVTVEAGLPLARLAASLVSDRPVGLAGRSSQPPGRHARR